VLKVISNNNIFNICESSDSTSSFRSCIATLANPCIGLKPFTPLASERCSRSQLLIANAYRPGVGVDRELISLPAPTLLGIVDSKTGSMAVPLLDDAVMTLSLDDATVTASQLYELAGSKIKFSFSQALLSTTSSVVSVFARLEILEGSCETSRLIVYYGLSTSAQNEYLGGCGWLTSKGYSIGQSDLDDGYLKIRVSTCERNLVYHVLACIGNENAVPCHINLGGLSGAGYAIPFDISTDTPQAIAFQWSVTDEVSLSHKDRSDLFAEIKSSGLKDRQVWKGIWAKHDVEIDAAGLPVELGIRYAIFQLLQHGFDAYKVAPWQVSPARGLTSTYHSGSVFFDTELHKIIYWIWNDPDVALAMLRYRFHFLEEAIDFAKRTGFKGARYPEASNDRGLENGPNYIFSHPHVGVVREWSSEEVLHVSADLVYAISKYCEITSDAHFKSNSGAAMVAACARFCASAFKWSSNKQLFVINNVMGPDEYHYHVNNNFYTNYMMRWCIVYALTYYDSKIRIDISAEEASSWKDISRQVFLPWFSVEGQMIPEQFEGFSKLTHSRLRTSSLEPGPRFLSQNEEEQAKNLINFTSNLVKQADVILLMSLFPDDFSSEVTAIAFRYYESLTTHESSLSYGPHAVVSANAGAVDKSAEYISQGSRYDLDFSNKRDYSNGIHLSAYAGAWQGLVQGLAGLRIEHGVISFFPQIPKNWVSYRFSVLFRKQQLHVEVCHGEMLVVRHKGIPVPLLSDGGGRVYLGEIKNVFT
jgi:hypothetical protein